MLKHLYNLQALLDEAYRNQSIIESMLPHHRDAEWTELWFENMRYIDELKDTYKRVSDKIYETNNKLYVIQGGKKND